MVVNRQLIQHIMQDVFVLFFEQSDMTILKHTTSPNALRVVCTKLPQNLKHLIHSASLMKTILVFSFYRILFIYNIFFLQIFFTKSFFLTKNSFLIKFFFFFIKFEE